MLSPICSAASAYGSCATMSHHVDAARAVRRGQGVVGAVHETDKTALMPLGERDRRRRGAVITEEGHE